MTSIIEKVRRNKKENQKNPDNLYDPFPGSERFFENMKILKKKLKTMSDHAEIVVPTVIVSIPLKDVAIYFAQKQQLNIEYVREQDKLIPYVRFYINPTDFDTPLAQIQEFETALQAYFLLKHMEKENPQKK